MRMPEDSGEIFVGKCHTVRLSVQSKGEGQLNTA